MDTETLTALYEQAGSVTELARRFDTPYATMYCRLKRLGIPIKRTGFRSPHPAAKHAEQHHNWRGGVYESNGYLYEFAPDHPAASRRKGYVQQHRLVMERHLGRLLTADELVHHINGDKADNRLENLELTTRSSHIRHHKAFASRDVLGRFAK